MKKVTIILASVIFLFLLTSTNSVGAEEYVVKNWKQEIMGATTGGRLKILTFNNWITYDSELSVICFYKSYGNDYPRMMTCWDATRAPDKIKEVVSGSRK